VSNGCSRESFGCLIFKTFFCFYELGAIGRETVREIGDFVATGLNEKKV